VLLLPLMMFIVRGFGLVTLQMLGKKAAASFAAGK